MEVLKEVASAHENVLTDPALSIEVLELGDSSVNLSCRPWVKTADYWLVFWGRSRCASIKRGSPFRSLSGMSI
jgi:small conductance mechanosensitive channel